MLEAVLKVRSSKSSVVFADLLPLAKNIKKLTPQEVAAGKAKANKAIWKEPKRR
jgi:hypothetical protein